MKKQLHAVFVLCMLIFAAAQSQTTTATYATGFDNTSQQAGWTQFRKGDMGFYEFKYTPNGYSAPSCLYHGYPVGGSTVTIDWFVSPVFDFSLGGKIDSLRGAFAGFGMPATVDTVAIFLLKGAADPDLATSKTLLFDFRGADYMNDNTWRKFSNINIPATPGQSYLAFKYKTVNNWLDVNFDNLKVSYTQTLNAVGISQTETERAPVVFPNPVAQYGAINLRTGQFETGGIAIHLYNILGALVFEEEVISSNPVPINQSKGVYLYQVTGVDGKIMQTGQLIVH